MVDPADPPGNFGAMDALLRWYVAMGADASVDALPRDRFAEGEPAHQVRPSRGIADEPVPRSGKIPHLPQRSPAAGATVSADEAARNCRTLEELEMVWAATPGCGLASSASHMIFAGGTAGAKLMIFGGAPESDDEREGQAFSGSKGQLLDAMLRAIGLSRADSYLANVVPWRPPGNRPPSPLELGFCMPFVRRHIELAKPEVLLCLGERAAQPLLATGEPVSRLRGRWLTYEGETRTTRTLVTFSLEYLLKQPLQKRRAWADLLQVASALRG